MVLWLIQGSGALCWPVTESSSSTMDWETAVQLQSVKECIRIYLSLSIPSQVDICYSLSGKYVCAVVKKIMKHQITEHLPQTGGFVFWLTLSQSSSLLEPGIPDCTVHNGWQWVIMSLLSLCIITMWWFYLLMGENGVWCILQVVLSRSHWIAVMISYIFCLFRKCTFCDNLFFP